MKYEVTGTFKTTVKASSSDDAINIAHSKYEGAESITAVEKEEESSEEKIERAKKEFSSLADTMRVLNDAFGSTVVSYEDCLDCKLLIGIGADKFLQTFKSYKVEPCYSDKKYRNLSVKFGDVQVYTYASEEKMDEYF